MIGAQYQSDQRIVDIYKDISTIAEDKSEKLPPEQVLNCLEWLSINNKSLMNFKPVRLRKVS